MPRVMVETICQQTSVLGSSRMKPQQHQWALAVVGQCVESFDQLDSSGNRPGTIVGPESTSSVSSGRNHGREKEDVRGLGCNGGIVAAGGGEPSADCEFPRDARRVASRPPLRSRESESPRAIESARQYFRVPACSSRNRPRSTIKSMENNKRDRAGDISHGSSPRCFEQGLSHRVDGRPQAPVTARAATNRRVIKSCYCDAVFMS